MVPLLRHRAETCSFTTAVAAKNLEVAIILDLHHMAEVLEARDDVGFPIQKMDSAIVGSIVHQEEK